MQARALPSDNGATLTPNLETSLAGAEVGPRAAHKKLGADRAETHGEVGGAWEAGRCGSYPGLKESWGPPRFAPALQPSTLQIFTLGSERLKIFSRSQMRRVSVPEILAKGVI